MYSSWTWRYGRSPKCEYRFRTRFDWGELEVHLHLEALHISEITIFSDALDTELPQKLEHLLTGRRYDMKDLDLTSLSDDYDEDQKEKILQAALWIASNFDC